MIAGKMAVKIEEENSQRESDKKSPLFWGAVVTVIYFAGFATFLFFFGKYPSGGLDLNEVGDFFAGLAGPLAFIWLVIAVIVQSRELAAQHETLIQQMEELKLGREELKLNRKEYRLNRKVLEEQGIEQKRHSEISDRILNFTERGLEVEALEIRLKNFLVKVWDEFKNIKYMQNEYHQGVFTSQDNDFKRYLRENQMLEATNHLLTYFGSLNKNPKKWVSFGEFDVLLNELNEITDKADVLKPNFDGFKFEEFDEKLEGIVLMQKEFEKNNA